MLLATSAGLPLAAYSRQPSKPHAIGLIRHWRSIGSGVLVTHFGSKENEPPQDFGSGGMWISLRSPKEETYFPGDIQGIPQRIEVHWLWDVNPRNDITYEESIANAKKASAVFDLHALIPQAVVDDLSSQRGGMIKLIFTFNDDKLDLTWDSERIDLKLLRHGYAMDK